MFFKIFEKKISFLNKYQKVLLIKNNKKKTMLLNIQNENFRIFIKNVISF